jgi:ribosomal protein L16 Arg81 hydroxylase
MFDFSELIRPITLDTFKQDYWEKKPLIVARNQRDFYAGLLTLADVDAILSMSSAQSSTVRVVRDGRILPLASLVGKGLYGQVGVLERLYAVFRGGATVVLLSLQERWKPLRQFCQSLAELFSASFQVNVYLTPPHSQGLKTHYDTHDVFVLQVSGTKRWRLYDAPVTLPLPGQVPVNDPSASKDASEEFELQAGELIYLPRGWRHDASTGDSVSLHLTIGVYPVTWAAVFLHAVEAAIEKDSRFRESLPIGFAGNRDEEGKAEARLGELVDVLRDMMDPAELIGSAAKAALLGRQPALDGHLLDLAAASEISPHWRLRKRTDLSWHLTVDGDRARLVFNGKEVALPADLEPELRFIADASEFTAEGLPGDLDGDSRMVLVKRLLEEGFLTVSDAS